VETDQVKKELYQGILKSQLSVRGAELLAEALQSKYSGKRADAPAASDFIQDLVDMMQQRLGTKVKIIERGQAKGQIHIDYYGLDDLDRILAFFTEGKNTL
jgi:ParB family chromosome partitioning protein